MTRLMRGPTAQLSRAKGGGDLPHQTLTPRHPLPPSRPPPSAHTKTLERRRLRHVKAAQRYIILQLPQQAKVLICSFVHYFHMGQ